MTAAPRVDSLSGRIVTVDSSRILDFIEGYVAEHHYPPTRSEIGRAVGIKNRSSVLARIRKLVADGRLRAEVRGNRTVRLEVVPGPTDDEPCGLWPTEKALELLGGDGA